MNTMYLSSRRASSTANTHLRGKSRAPSEYPDINTIRNAIPPHCFQPSLWISFAYLARDIISIAVLTWARDSLHPSDREQVAPHHDVAARLRLRPRPASCARASGSWRTSAGHGAVSLHKRVNSVVGWAAHSFLLVPFFSWKFSHARHHGSRATWRRTWRSCRAPRRTTRGASSRSSALTLKLFEARRHCCAVQVDVHQLFGWQGYLLFNVTAGPDSRHRIEELGPP